ncbi:MAG: OsmC family protein, partial [Candidatus Syntropharchaeia archaeon]
MDVVSILNKMKVDFDSFEILIDSERAEEHPKVFTKIHLIYRFKGKNLPRDKIEKAVKLSQERYCSVSAILRKSAEIDWEIEIEEE